MTANSHPWRTRTREFAKHLETLPKSERNRLTREEGRFMALRSAAFDARHRVAQDFAASMHGVREYVDSDG